MPQLYGKAQTFQPSAVAENQVVISRTTKYGDLMISQILRGAQGVAMEGALYIARPAPATGGSGTAMGIQTIFSDTANIALMLNNGDAAKTYIPVYIKTRCTAAGTTTTSSEIAIEVDNANRYSSGGSTMVAGKVNPSSSAPASNAIVRIGAITASAASGSRFWTNSFLIRQAVAPAWIVGDVCWYMFGVENAVSGKLAGPLDTQAAPGTIFNWPVLPVAIPAGGTMLVHIANVANATTAPSFEWEVAWIER